MGWLHLPLSFLVIWLGSDVWEFTYHYIGHVTVFGWDQHKPHHVFFNLSPFAVIADEALDQVLLAARPPIVCRWHDNVIGCASGLSGLHTGTSTV
jgi:sterol desaturase/sphingolipid hydroxylase (fatty acid hydroxylase superfamily)